jgi:hypothetical protein
VPLSDNEKIWLTGLTGVALGAVLMGVAASQRQQKLWQALQQQQGAAAVQQQTPQLQVVSSTGSLNTGWMYYVTIGMPGVDLTAAANQATAAQQLVAAGFVDPTSKGAPTLVPGNTNQATALTVYNGTQGSTVPASTATFQWISVLGSPAPEGLATV